MNRFNFTKEHEAQVTEMYFAGFTIKSIAEKIGCPPKSISNKLNRLGLAEVKRQREKVVPPYSPPAPPPEPLVEPEHIWFRDGLATIKARRAFIEICGDRAKALGMGWSRCTHSDDGSQVVFEAWATRPPEQGPVRWPAP